MRIFLAGSLLSVMLSFCFFESPAAIYAPRTWLLAIALLYAIPAQAVYRCETAGQVTYSDAACIDGKKLDINMSKGNAGMPSPLVTQNKAESKRLERERTSAHKQQIKAQQKAEREAARAKLIEDKQKRKCAQLAQRKKWADEDVRTATVKNLEKARRKSSRMHDQYRTECPV